jgi:hypothetical protein
VSQKAMNDGEAISDSVVEYSLPKDAQVAPFYLFED